MVNRPLNFNAELSRADDDIAAFEFGRSQGHQISYDDWESIGIPAAVDGERMWHAALAGENTLQMFLDEPAARTATLAILRLRGDWDAANQVQEGIIGPDSPLHKAPYHSKLIDRDSTEAKRIITVDWGITSVHGLTTVTTRRRLLRTGRITEDLEVGGNTRKFSAESHIEVDKLSTFALDIQKLNDIDPVAANEVRLIIICGMLATADIKRVHRAAMGSSSLKDYQAGGLKERRAEALKLVVVRHKMEQYKIAADDVVERLGTKDMTRIRFPETTQALEQEIADPSGLLIPSTVTFYGERVLHGLSRS